MQIKNSGASKAALVLAAALAAPCAMAQWGPPPTNASPSVRIITPHDGAIVLAGNIHICAAASYFTDRVESVRFFAGTNAIGVVTNSSSGWEEEGQFFCLTWSNVTAGAYALSAIATDLAGNSATSPVVDISVVTNLPPRVSILKPRNGAYVLGPTNVLICASAFDRDGSVTTVEFFHGTNSLGVVPKPPVIYVTNSEGVFPVQPPFCLTWSNAPLGTFLLTAVATDNGGDTATSAPVTIHIVSDLPPRVHIETPYSWSAFRAPANIKICAAASDPDGTVTSVQIFAGTNSLGVITTPTIVSNWWEVESLYCLVWSNAPAGSYALTAVATDNAGLSSTSAPVYIKVYPPPPPTVRITHPRNGATIYSAPTNIVVCAYESYFTNTVASVQFYAGTNSIGSTTNHPYSCIVWHAVPPGAYTLTAVATDSGGVNFTSAPVSINVVTNRPPSFWPDP